MRKLDNKGNISIIMCLVLSGLLGFTAYVVDIGLVYSERIKLSNAIDAAALAGVFELPNDVAKARTVAAEYLQKNNANSNDASIAVSEDNKSIQIRTLKNVKHILAPLIGINNSNVNHSTKAIIGPSKSIKGGIRPFAVEVFDFSYGSEVILKNGAGDGYHGNYGAVALGGQGASNFADNALYGYSGKISVGDFINTETGNMSGAVNSIKNYIKSEYSTFDNFPKDSIRLWKIPLLNTLTVNGRGEVQVVGFGQFYIEDISNNSGKTEITGRFIRYVSSSEIDMSLNDTGSYGAKLEK